MTYIEPSFRYPFFRNTTFQDSMIEHTHGHPLLYEFNYLT